MTIKPQVGPQVGPDQKPCSVPLSIHSPTSKQLFTQTPNASICTLPLIYFPEKNQGHQKETPSKPHHLTDTDSLP